MSRRAVAVCGAGKMGVESSHLGIADDGVEGVKKEKKEKKEKKNKKEKKEKKEKKKKKEKKEKKEKEEKGEKEEDGRKDEAKESEKKDNDGKKDKKKKRKKEKKEKEEKKMREEAEEELPAEPAGSAEKASKDGGSTSIMLFYLYLDPQWSPAEYSNAKKTVEGIARQNGITGRMRIAKEGVNCTVTGSHDGIVGFREGLKGFDHRFEQCDFKIKDGLQDGQKFKEVSAVRCGRGKKLIGPP